MNRRELVKTLADKLSVTQVEAMRFIQAFTSSYHISHSILRISADPFGLFPSGERPKAQ